MPCLTEQVSTQPRLQLPASILPAPPPHSLQSVTLPPAIDHNLRVGGAPWLPLGRLSRLGAPERVST